LFIVTLKRVLEVGKWLQGKLLKEWVEVVEITAEVWSG
jgi:hypothetical protein